MNLHEFHKKRRGLKRELIKTGKSYSKHKKEKNKESNNTDSPYNNINLDDFDTKLSKLIGTEYLFNTVDSMYDSETQGKIPFAELYSRVKSDKEKSEKMNSVQKRLHDLQQAKNKINQARHNFMSGKEGLLSDDEVLNELNEMMDKVDEEIESLKNSSETRGYARMSELLKYQQEFQKGFVYTPSRKEAVENLANLVTEGNHVFLEGDSGTGKTEILRNMVQNLENYQPYIVSCSDQTKLSDLLGKTKLEESKLGATVTSPQEGVLVRALIEGKKIIFDEFNNMDSNVRFSLKPYYNLKPGDTFTVSELGSGIYTVKEGFGFLATGNLPSEKHPERKDLDPAETREFKMPHLNHMPVEEIYDILLISSLRKDQTSALNYQEASETIKKLADAIEGVHQAYEGTNDEVKFDLIKDQKAILKKAVLDPKEYISWVKGYKDQTALGLQQYLAERISTFISKGDFPESDRQILFQIFATKNLVDGVNPQLFGFNPKDAQSTLNWSPTFSSEKEQNRNLSLEKLAELDPYNVRPIEQTSTEDYLKQRGIEKTNQTQEVLTTIEHALEIMGEEQFLGPQDIQNTFGFYPESIPEILFSEQELEKAKELGQQLVLYVDRTNNKTPLTVEKMSNILGGKTSDNGKIIYSNKHIDYVNLKVQTPRVCWRLTTPEIIRNSTSKKYLEQTEEIINYVSDKVFENQNLPEKYQEAIDEFNKKRNHIEELMEEDWQKAVHELSGLLINQMTREQSSEIIYRLILEERKNGIKNLFNKYSWSNSIDAGGGLVRVGFFDSGGASVDRWEPGIRNSNLGVCFSRSE